MPTEKDRPAPSMNISDILADASADVKARLRLDPERYPGLQNQIAGVVGAMDDLVAILDTPPNIPRTHTH